MGTQTQSHPDFDTLFRLAESEVDDNFTPELANHLAACDPCRKQVGRLRGFLQTAADELLQMRPGCPAPDELSQLPPGAEHDDPHLRECSLCRQEVRWLFELESRERFGLEGLDGPFLRAARSAVEPSVAYQATAPVVSLELKEGAMVEGRLGTVAEAATVRISCHEQHLIVLVDGELSGDWQLILSNEVLEKQLPLTSGETRVPVARWQHVRVERATSPD